MTDKIVNIHLISDSTGETLSSVSRAVLSQFEGVESNDFIWPLIRTKSQIEKVVDSIESLIVLKFSIVLNILSFSLI